MIHFRHFQTFRKILKMGQKFQSRDKIAISESPVRPVFADSCRSLRVNQAKELVQYLFLSEMHLIKVVLHTGAMCRASSIVLQSGSRHGEVPPRGEPHTHNQVDHFLFLF